MFATHKRHILGRNRMFWRILRQNPPRALACSELQEPKKTQKLTFWCAKSRMRGSETPERIVTNFCTGVGVHDVITCGDLYYDRLRSLGVAGGVKFWLSPLTCFVALTYRVRKIGRPIGQIMNGCVENIMPPDCRIDWRRHKNPISNGHDSHRGTLYTPTNHTDCRIPVRCCKCSMSCKGLKRAN